MCCRIENRSVIEFQLRELSQCFSKQTPPTLNQETRLWCVAKNLNFKILRPSGNNSIRHYAGSKTFY